MQGLAEARSRFASQPGSEPPAAAAGGPSAALRAGRLAPLLARLGPFLEGVRTVLVSAAIVAILVVIGWSILAEARRQGIVVERIEVPRAMEELGLRGEVVASRLVDAIAEASAAAVWRGERPAVAMGWKTADFQVPALGLSMGTLVRMVEELAGRPDRRVGGELVRVDGAATLRLRISPPRLGEEPISLSVVVADDRPTLDDVLARAAEELLRRLDPMALAAHLLVDRLERSSALDDPAAVLGALDEVLGAVDACLIEPTCRERDRAQAHALRGAASRRAAVALGPGDPEARRALLEDALQELELARGPDGLLLEAALRRADTLLDLDREAEALAAFAEAAIRHPGSARPLRDAANALARAGRYAEAADRLEAAVRLAPTDAWAHLEHGMALRRSQRPEAAIEAFRRAVRLDGRLHCAFEEWGRTLEEEGRIEAGRRRLDQAARLRGGSPHCRWPRA